MKRKLKITYGQLEATQERVSVFRNALENMDSAIEMFQNILSEQQSDAITALLEDGRDLRDEMELLHGNLQELENMLSGYIQDMTALVMPKSWDSMMLVDRNDIWVNMKQIKSNVSDTEQVIWGGALQHYKDVHTHISKPHISSSMTESEKRSAREEYDRKVRERAQREENYKKLKAFTETQAKQAKQELEECYKEIEDLYRNRIVVYENTDDEYKKTAMDLYQQCTSFGQRLKDLVTKTEEMKWDVRRGALAAVLDLVKTALAIQDLKNTLDTLPFAVVAEVMGIEVPGLSLAKVDDLKNMAYGAVAALQEPPRVLAALGQKIGDTVEEEGIAYSISYVAADVAIQVLLSKGLGEVKNVSKADDLVDVARTVDTLDDTVKIADELTDAAKAVDKVGDIKDATMAMNVMDETKAAVKAVDNVSDAAKTVEKIDNVIESGNYSSLRDLMSPEEIARYNEHWVNVAENISNESLDNQIAFIKSGGITKPGGGKYRPTKISATVDLRTGDICFGYNGANKFNPSKMDIHPILQERIQYTKSLAANSLDNPFASKQSFEIWSVDNCAEVYSVNNALLNGTSWDDLFINTKYFKNGEWASPCKNCKITFENVYMPKKGN